MIKSILAASAVAGILTVAGCVTSHEGMNTKAENISYPQTRAMDVTDDFFGTTVADPYRWLENEDAFETGEWIEAENAITFPMLAELPSRQGYIDRITELFNYERFGTPYKEGGRYFYSRNDGLQNQSVVLVADSLDAEPRVLLDPNTFAEDGTIALSGSSVSPDGKLYAYSKSDGGTDWDDWYVLNIDSGELLGDHIGGTKFSGLSWARDSSGFYYSRYPDGEEGGYDDQKPVVVYYHAIGTEQADDALIVDLGHATRNPYAGVTEDGRYLIVSQWDGYTINGVSYMTLGSEDTELRPIIDHWDPADPLAGRYSFMGNEGSTFFFSTTQGAPNRRVIAIDADNPVADNWDEVIPEAAEAMESVGYVGNRLVAQYLRDATSLVKVFGTDGTLEREVTLPGLGSVGGFGGHQDDTETFYSFTRVYNTPPRIYRYDILDR